MKRTVTILIAFIALTEIASGQKWVSVGGGVDEPVFSYTILNDELYISGYNDVKKWDGFSWTTISTGNNIQKLIGFKNQLYSLFVKRKRFFIGRFNGTNWDTIGISSQIPQHTPTDYEAMEVYNDELYVSANFDSINGFNFNKIARWNNVSWNSVGNGLNNPALKLQSFNNDLYAIGCFTKAGNDSAKNIAKWNGVAWDSLGSGLLSCCKGSWPNGYDWGGFSNLKDDIYISSDYVYGDFTWNHYYLGDSITKWDGSKWNSVGTNEPLKGYTKKMTEFDNKLYFIPLNSSGKYLPVWDGVNWSIVTTDNGIIDSIFANDFFVFRNELHVTGELYTKGNKEEGIIKLQYLFTSTSNCAVGIANVQISPIPTISTLSISIPSNISVTSIEVFDLFGRKISTQNSLSKSSSYTINMEGQPKGCYFVRINSSDGIVNRKFILQ